MARVLPSLIFAVILSGSFWPSAWAAIFDVTRTDDPAPDGCMPADCSLREAVVDANGNDQADVINIPAGAYMLTIPGPGEFMSMTGDLNLRDDVDLIGAGTFDTSIDAGDLDRVFTNMESVTTNVTGVTLRNGEALSGGCVANSGSLFLENVVLRECHASNSGGGLVNSEPGTLHMVDSRVMANSSQGGAGIFNNGTATIEFSHVDGNAASFSGGGVTNNIVTAQMTILDSTISGNFANTDFLFTGGGGLSNGGQLIVRRSTISGNSATASDGGGLNNLGGHVTLINVSLSGNNAASEGGAIWTANGSVDLVNCTIADNTAATAGGVFESNPGAIALATIIANNSGGNCNTALLDVNCGEFPSLDSEDSCGLCLINTNPLLGPLADNGGPSFTHALMPGSPAIDGSNGAATGAGCIDPLTGSTGLAVDQRGAPRPQDGDGVGDAVCDIGAYEKCPDSNPNCEIELEFFDGFEDTAR